MSDVQIAVIDQQDTQIVLAVPGVQGATGSSIPSGGTIDQVLRKNSSTDYDAGWTQVTSAMIANGAIVNEDINNGAGIAGTKISPDFGGQAVTTTGQVSAARVNVTNNTPPSNGIYLPSANNVAISTNGSGRLFVDSSGRVGIGGSPSTALHLGGSSSQTIRINSNTSAGFVGTIGYITQIAANRNPIDGSIINTGTATAFINLEADVNNGNIQFCTTSTNNASAQERLRITSTGTVNIVGAGSAGSTQAVSFNGSAPVNSLVLTSGGLVGVGTSSPGAVLHSVGTNSGLPVTSGTTQTYCSLRLGGSNSTGIVDFGISGSANWIQSTDRTDLSQKYSLLLNPNGGNVGIGTTSPTGIFEACGSSSYFRPTGAAGTFLQITAGAANGDVTLSASANSGGYPPLVFSTGGGEKARLTASGQLLVGTSSSRSDLVGLSPQIQLEGATQSATSLSLTRNEATNAGPALLLAKSRGTTAGAATVVQSGDILGGVYFMGADGTNIEIGAQITGEVDATPGNNDLPSRLVFSVTRDGQASPTPAVRIDNTGQNAIYASATSLISSSAVGSGSTEYVFVGQHSATAFANGTDCIRITTNGNVTNLNNSYGQISDQKLKENVVAANSQWSDVKAIQVKNFNFIGSTDRQIGVIAQEVEAVSPGLVDQSPDRDEDGNDLGTVTKSVKYSVLYMKAVKALQEAMERIEQLEAKVSVLEAKP